MSLRKAIGAVIRYLKRNKQCAHVWGRPHDFYQGGEIFERVKQCKLCGITRHVKRRVKKEAK